MFAFAIDWIDTKERLQSAFDGHVRRWAGAAFVALALFAIEYDEFILPEMNRLSDAWGSVATDLGRKLASLAL